MPSKIAEHMSVVSNKVVDARYAVLPFSSVEDNTIKNNRRRLQKIL